MKRNYKAKIVLKDNADTGPPVDNIFIAKKGDAAGNQHPVRKDQPTKRVFYRDPLTVFDV